MSRLPSIRLASLGALALVATLTLGGCANSPTGLQESTVQQNILAVGDSNAAGPSPRFGFRKP